MKTYDIGGAKIEVDDRGRGLPVLFVHGFPLDHSMWQAQIDELSAGYRTIAPDLRGFGASGPSSGTVTMRQFADDLATLLDQFKVTEPVVLCGLSMGGYVAWQFWRHHGQRLRALILCDTKASADSEEAVAGRHKLAAAVIATGHGAARDAMLPKLFARGTAERQPVLLERTKGMIGRAQPESIAAALRGMAERPDATPWLAQIRVPTLVIVGAEDTITTLDEMRGMADKIDGAELVVVPEAGHMAPMERPDIVTPAIASFLDRLSG
ncbi:MAG: alpha/beta fold hydrolase [Pirellulales bacterium]|nr:alpha/beta fold hydrolase [Pirellulales bacterium]